MLGNPDKVKYVGVTTKVRFTVLQSGEIDVLIRDSTLTFTRDTQLNLDEVAVNFYAGQAFMVKKALNVASAKEMNGATICMLTGATLELNIADYGAANNIKIESLLFEKPEEAFAAAEAGRCDGYTDDSGSRRRGPLDHEEPRRLDDPARHDLQGAAGHPRPRGRRQVGGHPEVGALRPAHRRGAGRHQGQCRSDEGSGPKDPTIRRLLGLEGDFGDPARSGQ